MPCQEDRHELALHDSGCESRARCSLASEGARFLLPFLFMVILSPSNVGLFINIQTFERSDI